MNHEEQHESMMGYINRCRIYADAHQYLLSINGIAGYTIEHLISEAYVAGYKANDKES